MAIQYSIQKMVSDGTLSTIALGIQYLQRNDIYIRVAGEETPQSGAPSGYTWSFLDNTTLKILPVVPNGVEVVVYRRTDVDAMYNIYSQNAQFDEATIDENNQQLLYIAQEYLEQGIPGAGVDTIEFVRDDNTYTYYRIKRTDGSYSDEFAVPSAGSHTLRTDLAEKGADLVGYRYSGIGTRRTVRTKLDERVSLVDFHHNNGAYVTPGPGVDSRPYIQSAIDYLKSIGGGTLVIPETTSGWYLGSFGSGGLTSHSGIIKLRSNVNIELKGKVQLDDYFSGKVFQIFVGFDGDAASSTNLNNVHIYGGGIIDFGNFPEPTSGNVLRNGITFGKSYDCSLRGVTMQNGDVTWAVTTGWNGYGDRTYVEDCTFYNLVQTTKNPDHSTIYINCPNSGVRRCSFYAPAPRGRDVACAVELHQHDNWFEDCAISGYARGCYVTMHGAEAMEAGAYMYNVKVKGNSGDIAGQFAVFVADFGNGEQGHINGAIVSDNIIVQPEGYANGAFILYADGGEGGLLNFDVSGVLVANNHYTTPSTSDSTAFQSYVTVSGVTFIGNYFDTRRAVKAPGIAVCRDLIWDESNVIGPKHSGMRAGISLFELRYTTVVNTHIIAKLRSPDTSMYSVILVPPACVIRDSVLIVCPDFITTDRNAIVYEAGQQDSPGLQTEYPITVEFTSPSSIGFAPYMSTLTSFGWASSATPLSNASGLTFYTPSALSVKGTGQLGGIGWNDLTESRTVHIRVLIKRFL